jgi:hypothetical protein
MGSMDEPGRGDAIDAMRACVRALEGDADLRAPSAFLGRIRALERLETEVLDRIGPGAPAPDPETDLDAAWFAGQRAALRASPDPGRTFRDLLESLFPAAERLPPGSPPGFDDRDAFLNGIFHPDPIPDESLAPGPDMVGYQKTPARIALDLCARAGLSPADFFYDVGSGLGQIPILAHLLTGARARGIERDPAFAAYAGNCIRALGLSAVECVNADAREADYAPATALFLYTPFRGALLDEVLGRIRRQCRTGTRLFAFGPCIGPLAGKEWLAPLWPPPPGTGYGLAGFKLAHLGGGAGP